MDSGNSGSLQSSSGGDDEYDSRAAGSSIFMNTHVLGGPISNSPPPPSPQFHFDPFSNFMQLHHPNTAWPRPTFFRSDPNPTPSHHDISNNPIMSAGSSNFTHSLRPLPAVGEANNGSTINGVAPTNHAAAARNTRKRSRASRRAPTTVLATDTTNFRAMVQEFTGIPAAPPFINTSLFPRSSGLDLFRPRSAAFDAPPPPPYIRRPFEHKDQSPPPPPQFLVSTAAHDGGGGGMGGSCTANNKNIPSAVSSTLLSSTQNWNLFSNDVVPNPVLVTQTNPKFLFSNCNNGVMNNPDHGDDDDNQADYRMKLVGGSHNFSRSRMNGEMSYSG